MTVVVQWCNYILPICLKPSHIYATQYKPYNACTCTKSMKLKICINSIIKLLHWHVLILDFFKNKSEQNVTY